MQEKSSRNRQILVMALTLVILLCFALVLLFNSSSKFHIVRTNPSEGQISYLSPFFDISFNKTLDNNVSLSGSSGLIKDSFVNGKTIDIDLNQMTIGNNYFIEVDYASSSGHNVIKNDILKFTAKNISAEVLPKDQQKTILKNQEDYPALTDNPIFKYLPHSTLDYTLSALITKGPNGASELILQANIFLSQVDMSNETAAINGYEQYVVSYIKSLGLNPDDYTISYSIHTP